MNVRLVPAFFLLAASLALSATADAQDLAVRYAQKHVSIGLSIGNRHAPPHPRARPSAYERREWIPSHYETITERVWIPGREERVLVPAVHEWRTDACGRLRQVVVCPAHYETRCAPGHFETVTRKVWVEGGWRVRHCR